MTTFQNLFDNKTLAVGQRGILTTQGLGPALAADFKRDGWEGFPVEVESVDAVWLKPLIDRPNGDLLSEDPRQHFHWDADKVKVATFADLDALDLLDPGAQGVIVGGEYGRPEWLGFPVAKVSTRAIEQGLLMPLIDRPDTETNSLVKADPRSVFTWDFRVIEHRPVAKQETPEPEVERPLIDFSTNGRATARRYAAASISKTMDKGAQDTLQAVANGEKVDAVRLSEALAEAFSAASTRFGQSMDRREATSKLRHLAYITNGVLDNLASNRPVVEGPRSKALDEAKSALRTTEVALSTVKCQRDKAIEQRDRAREGRETFKAKVENLEEARTAWHTENARLLALLNGRAEQHDSDLRDATEAAKAAEEQRDHYASALEYAVSLLPKSKRERVFGYQDGLNDQA